jgi:hypothetical protein
MNEHEQEFSRMRSKAVEDAMSAKKRLHAALEANDFDKFKKIYDYFKNHYEDAYKLINGSWNINEFFVEVIKQGDLNLLISFLNYFKNDAKLTAVLPMEYNAKAMAKNWKRGLTIFAFYEQLQKISQFTLTSEALKNNFSLKTNLPTEIAAHIQSYNTDNKKFMIVMYKKLINELLPQRIGKAIEALMNLEGKRFLFRSTDLLALFNRTIAKFRNEIISTIIKNDQYPSFQFFDEKLGIGPNEYGQIANYFLTNIANPKLDFSSLASLRRRFNFFKRVIENQDADKFKEDLPRFKQHLEDIENCFKSKEENNLIELMDDISKKIKLILDPISSKEPTIISQKLNDVKNILEDGALNASDKLINTLKVLIDLHNKLLPSINFFTKYTDKGALFVSIKDILEEVSKCLSADALKYDSNGRFVLNEEVIKDILPKQADETITPQEPFISYY